MSNIQILDGNEAGKYIKSAGAGSSGDPYVPSQNIDAFPARIAATGTAGSLNADAIASTDVRQYNTAIVQVTGTWVGTLSPQLSNDNTNFVTVSGFQLGGSIPASGVTTNGIFYVPLVGDNFRVRMTLYTSGTATVNVSYSTMPFQALSTFVQIGGTPAVTATGNIAAGVSDSGSPVKTGGIYSTTLPTLTNGQRGNTQIEVNGVAAAQMYGYGSGAIPVALRTPDKYTDLNAVAITTIATVWTPVAGKKFRLMGITISVSSACSVLFEDNTAGNTVFRTPQLAANSPYNVDLANGYLSATINNVLKATASTGTVTITGTLYGTEL